MAWKIYFNGQNMGAVNDDAYQDIHDSIVTAGRAGDIAIFGTEVGGVKRTAIWTLGAPISFEHFDETVPDES